MKIIPPVLRKRIKIVLITFVFMELYFSMKETRSKIDSILS